MIGAAIGAIGGLSGGWLTLLGQRSQQGAERDRWRDEARRNAYVECVASTKRLAAAQWKMADSLEAGGSTPEEWQASFVVVHDAWTEFSAAIAAVTVAGPRSVADAADALRTAMYAIEEVGMEWLDAAKEIGHRRSPEFRSRFVATAVAKRQPDKEFQAAARAALHTESP